MEKDSVEKELIIRPIARLKKSGKIEGYPKYYQDVLVFFPIPDEFLHMVKENELWECEVINAYYIKKKDKRDRKIYQKYIKPIRKIKDLKLN